MTIMGNPMRTLVRGLKLVDEIDSNSEKTRADMS
jgi:hypothetical protein